MTKEEIINEVQKANGGAAAKIPTTPITEEINVTGSQAAFLAKLAGDFGKYDYREKLPNGQEFLFQFPSSIAELKELSKLEGEPIEGLTEELINAAALMGATNVEPGLDAEGFAWIARNSGRVFLVLAQGITTAFTKALALMPGDVITEGKDA